MVAEGIEIVKMSRLTELILLFYQAGIMSTDVYMHISMDVSQSSCLLDNLQHNLGTHNQFPSLT